MAVEVNNSKPYFPFWYKERINYHVMSPISSYDQRTKWYYYYLDFGKGKGNKLTKENLADQRS